MAGPRVQPPTRLRPWGVALLLLANGVAFAVELWLLAGPAEAERAAELVGRYALVPRELLRGANAWGSPVWWTPVTSMFLHAGWLHLLGNLGLLWVFGRRIEALLGPARLLLLYAACGLSAAVAQVASAPASFEPLIGASGAVAGLLGAYLVSPGAPLPDRSRRDLPASLFALVWLALQLGGGAGIVSAAAGVAWWAHLAGFLAGAVLAPALWVRKPTQSRLRI